MKLYLSNRELIIHVVLTRFDCIFIEKYLSSIYLRTYYVPYSKEIMDFDQNLSGILIRKTTVEFDQKIRILIRILKEIKIRIS